MGATVARVSRMRCSASARGQVRCGCERECARGAPLIRDRHRDGVWNGTHRTGGAVMSARAAATAFAILLAFLLAASSPTRVKANDEDGIVRVKSAYPMAETMTRLKKDLADKGIILFSEIDQSDLAAKAGVKVLPSTLLVFGNPRLGALFLASSPASGLDWPVRLLVHQDENGDVWAVYSDFAWIARRYRIEDRDDAFATASNVIASITSSVQAK